MNTLPKITRGANRCTVEVNGRTLYFSYDSLVAFEGPVSGPVRVPPVSATTRRHMGDMGVMDWRSLTPEAFADAVAADLAMESRALSAAEWVVDLAVDADMYGRKAAGCIRDGLRDRSAIIRAARQRLEMGS